MGNVSSCTPSIISAGVVKVFTSDGRLIIYTKGITAAELMIENQGELVCDASSLNVGQRISAVNADEELEPRQSYFLLPVEMLYSVLTNEELCYLNDRASKAVKNGTINFSKFFFVDFQCLFPGANKKLCFAVDIDNEDENKDEEDLSSSSSSSSRIRSWKPALNTIIEVPTPPYAKGRPS